LSTPQLKGRKPKSSRHLFAKLIAIPIIIILIMLTIADITDRLHYSAIHNELDRIHKTVIEPAGSVANGKPASMGNGFLDSIRCWPDLTCPYINQSWLVPLDNDKAKQKAFTDAILQGYRTSVYGASGQKGNFYVLVDTAAVGSDKIPSPAPSDKEWFSVTVYIDWRLTN
jgi:hypothetical protein